MKDRWWLVLGAVVVALLANVSLLAGSHQGTAQGIAGATVVTAESTSDPDNPKSASAPCPPGWLLTSGGAEIAPAFDKTLIAPTQEFAPIIAVTPTPLATPPSSPSDVPMLVPLATPPSSGAASMSGPMRETYWPFATIVSSKPTGDNPPTGWKATAVRNSDAPRSWKIIVYAVCWAPR